MQCIIIEKDFVTFRFNILNALCDIYVLKTIFSFLILGNKLQR